MTTFGASFDWGGGWTTLNAPFGGDAVLYLLATNTSSGDLSGTYFLLNVNSGMALDVSGGQADHV